MKNLLKANDFEILVMSNFSFADQVKLFNNANFVIGLHGGGFANLVFCEQKREY